MNRSGRALPAEPFFLKAGSGTRFCLYHAPNPQRQYRGSILYVHPFAEEMNKSRRMAALQARSFAHAGIGVLQIDLFGCGDSSGEFGDARWQIWKDDLGTATQWLEDRARQPVSLWGLRLGALLALDFAAEATSTLNKLLLWQPVISGESFLTQFLRMRLASEMLADRNDKTKGTEKLRDMLATGETVEVAGYEVAPSMAASIDRLSAVNFAVTDIPVHWFEVVPEAGRSMPPAAVRVASAWQQRGINLHVHLVPGPSFWSTQEIAECPALLSATSSLFSEALS
jgi:exosortase A-associated hydrolase 2